MSPRLLVIVGPTGSGKSALALRLAEVLGGEIVSCDALQVYRGFDAATSKPAPEERRRVVHHLVDHVDPRRDYTLADYVCEAEGAIEDVARRGRVPIVAGGTGLYLRGLLRGIIAAPPRDSALRRRLQSIAGRGGARRLHRLLARADPPSARRIAPADTQRLVRAIELARADGPSWSERLTQGGTWQAQQERYPTVKIGLDLPRERLAARLDARVEGFFARGLVAEVEGLLAAGVPAEANAFKAIGYREVLAALRAGRDPRETRDEVACHTRRYAKRQRTWFRGEPGVLWLPADRDVGEIATAALASWDDALGVHGASRRA